MASTKAFNRAQFRLCFNDWIAQQHQDLEEILAQQSTNSKIDKEKLQLLIEKSINHFEEYSEKRVVMVQHDALSFLAPSWCSSFENSFLWIGGCRPSLSIRRLYSVCGSELNDHLSEFLLNKRKGNLAAHQLHMTNTLHCKIVQEEDKLSTNMATLQEDIAELPMKSVRAVQELREEVECAIDAHCLSLASILKDADKLRLSTLKELIDILTPGQGVDLLLATKKLHLSMHKWGKRMHRQSKEKETMISN